MNWYDRIARRIGKDKLTSEEANIAFLVRQKAMDACISKLNTEVCPYDSGPYKELMTEVWESTVNNYYNSFRGEAC